jgi:hypothetical protein
MLLVEKANIAWNITTLRTILFSGSSGSLDWAVRRTVGFIKCIIVKPFLVVYALSTSNKRVVAKFEWGRFLVL